MTDSAHVDVRMLAFVGTAAVLVAVPGPSVVFAIGRGLTLTRPRALTAVLGNALGVMLQVVGLALGLGELIERSATAFTVVKLAGAVYLVYLGSTAIRHRHDVWRQLGLDTSGGRAAAGLSRCLLDGVLVGALNPKTIVFFAAFLPLFIDPGRGATPQLLGLGVVFCVIAVVLDSIWVVSAGAARSWFARSPRRAAALGGAGGAAMIGLGIGVAATERAT